MFGGLTVSCTALPLRRRVASIDSLQLYWPRILARSRRMVPQSTTAATLDWAKAACGRVASALRFGRGVYVYAYVTVGQPDFKDID